MGKQQHNGPLSNRKGITSDRRYVVAEWMYQVCERIYPERELSRAVFHQAVSCLDVVLLTPQEYFGITLVESSLQLLGLSCVELAIERLFQSGVLSRRPKSTNMLAFCGDKFTDREFCHYQNRIEMLKPFTGLITAVDSFFKYLDEGLNEGAQTQSLALVLLDSFILDHSTRKHPPHFVALAAVAVARRLLLKQVSFQWTPELVSLTGFSVSDFQQCYDEMFYVAYLLFKDNAPCTTTEPRGVSVYKPVETLVH